MTFKQTIIGTLLASAVAIPALPAQACGGHGPMAGAMLPGVGMAVPGVGMALAVPGLSAAVSLPAMGATVAALPAGYLTVVVNGSTFFRAGPTWYQPFQGPAGHMYQVVPAPHGM